MYWEYRIITKDVGFGEFEQGIHEVRYSDEGEIISWRSIPVELSWLIGENPRALVEEFLSALEKPPLKIEWNVDDEEYVLVELVSH